MRGASWGSAGRYRITADEQGRRYPATGAASANSTSSHAHEPGESVSNPAVCPSCGELQFSPIFTPGSPRRRRFTCCARHATSGRFGSNPPSRMAGPAPKANLYAEVRFEDRRRGVTGLCGLAPAPRGFRPEKYFQNRCNCVSQANTGRTQFPRTSTPLADRARGRATATGSPKS
jgi:hypothetical protein